MDLKSEVIGFVVRTAHENSDAFRNREVIEYMFGFGAEPWPTLEQAAQKFRRTPELIRRIVKNYFTSRARLAGPSVFPVARAVARGIENLAPITANSLIAQLEHKGLNAAGISVPGLFELLHTLNLVKNINLYGIDFRPATRSDVERGDSVFAAQEADVSELRVGYRSIQKLPSSSGLAILTSEILAVASPREEFFVSLLRHDRDAVVVDDDSRVWFAFENRENVPFNDLCTIHAAYGCAMLPLQSMSESLLNSIRGRARGRGKYPPATVVEKYLRKSRFLEISGDAARIKDAMPPARLTAAECDALEYLRSISPRTTDAPKLRDELVRLGHGLSTAKILPYRSPFIAIKKSTIADYELGLLALPIDLEDWSDVLDAPATERLELLKCRIGQGKFRDGLLRLRGRCHLTGIADERFLRASHIKPWHASDQRERVDPHNGLLEAPHFDHLFDHFFISLDQEGRLLVADDVPLEIREKLGITDQFVRQFTGCDLGAATNRYLEFHRRAFFERARLSPPRATEDVLTESNMVDSLRGALAAAPAPPARGK